MLTLHIFNPEHDLALAYGQHGYTTPRAAAVLQNDLAFLMAIFAEEGDFVLTPDKKYASQCLRQWGDFLPQVELVSWADGLGSLHLKNVNPWGWDESLRYKLLQNGLHEGLVPAVNTLRQHRNQSHRNTSVSILSSLRQLLADIHTVGEMECVTSINSIQKLLHQGNKLMLKAPWSSSGRGVVAVESRNMPANIQRWAENILHKQGGLMIEPLYNRVCDFAMEFFIENDNTVRYAGLSLFKTSGTQYTGNVIASEEVKQRLLKQWISADELHKVRTSLQLLISKHLSDCYKGPLGVDMMIVENIIHTPSLPHKNRPDATSYALHPCVEVNLRCTMGHVALALSKRNPDLSALMQIEYTGRFQLNLLSTPWDQQALL